MLFDSVWKKLPPVFSCVMIALALSACGGAEGEGSSSSAASAVSTGVASGASVATSSVSSSSASVVVNNPPVIAGLPVTTATVGVAYSFQTTATDADGDLLTYSVSNVPAWATFNAETHVLSGIPVTTGSYAGITISVSDGKTSVSLAPFTLTVSAAVGTNRAPVITGSPATSIAPGSAYRFTPGATDADGDALIYSISKTPGWATFNTATHTLSGTPTAADRGTTTGIIVSVSDSKGGVSALAPFDITVVNRAPVLSGNPATSVAAGSAYSFVPSGTDADGDALTFAVANKPAWASFNSATGALTGTPTSAQKGTYSTVTVSANDGHGGTAQLASFAITVMNTAPTVTGTPATTGSVGVAYSFAPVGSDANGDVLAYSITNKPSWATFNTATGSLTGVPGTAGSYAGIVITVSDGTASAALPAFSITISAAAGTATLSWTAPTQNTDGSLLTDLTGYTIYYGTSSTNLSNSISVNSPGTTSYTVTGLTSGVTYYFAISALNSVGVASALSGVGSKTI